MKTVDKILHLRAMLNRISEDMHRKFAFQYELFDQLESFVFSRNYGKTCPCVHL